MSVGQPGQVGSVALRAPGRDSVLDRLAYLEHAVFAGTTARSTSPLVAVSIDTGSGVSLSTGAAVEVWFGLFTVPEGYTQASVVCVVDIGGTNGNPFATEIFAAAAINGTSPTPLVTTCQPSAQTSLTATYAAVVTGLSGGDAVRVSAYASTTDLGWSGQVAHVAASSVFLL